MYQVREATDSCTHSGHLPVVYTKQPAVCDFVMLLITQSKHPKSWSIHVVHAYRCFETAAGFMDPLTPMVARA